MNLDLSCHLPNFIFVMGGTNLEVFKVSLIFPTRMALQSETIWSSSSAPVFLRESEEDISISANVDS